MFLKILVVHNEYQQRGGEDSVVEAEIQLLRSAGYDVETLIVSNTGIDSPWAAGIAALNAIYSAPGYRRVRVAIRTTRPDLVHVHNFFPLLSPAVFSACADENVPNVWTLHNFRVACVNGLLLRDGHPCEDCIGRMPWSAVRNRCYRGSLPGSMAVAAMIGYHQLAGTWHKKVTCFIALTDFARNLYIRMGLPADKIVVKPNFIHDPEMATVKPEHRKGFACVGRLSHEKGIQVLLGAWEGCDIPLKIVGDGPLMAVAREAAERNPAIAILGLQPKHRVYEVISSVKALIMPSIWYENLPVTFVEAMAIGTPVIASRTGAMATLVEAEGNGLHFETGNAQDLRRVLQDAITDPHRLTSFGIMARNTYENTFFFPESNLKKLTSIYREALQYRTFREGL
jgi:glycosyltransferase involved in cell wall biosynthesis